jgi:ribosomal protein S12 methylthiotransferase accessory factor
MEPLDLDRVLAFKPSLRVAPTDSGALFLVGERERFVIADEHTNEIAALVDGRRAVREIIEAASTRVSAPKTIFILSKLLERGYVAPAAREVPSDTAAFWAALGVDAHTAREALQQAPVLLQSVGDDVAAASMADALEQAGVRVARDSKWSVVVTDDYLRPDLKPVGERAAREGKPWWLIKPSGVSPLIGPLFWPGAGPCWECLAFWIRNNQPVEELLRRRQGLQHGFTVPRAGVPASVRATCGLAALAIARALMSADGRPLLDFRTHLLSLDLATFESKVHAVVRRPQCPGCGDSSVVAAIGRRPVVLQPVSKGHCDDGGYRRQAPEETYKRFNHLVSPLTGAVTHLTPMPGRNTELRSVYASGYMICPRDGIPTSNQFDKPCAGKGRSPEQARVSALCEAVERFSSVYQGDEAHVRGSLDEMGAAAVHPRELQGFSDQQYRSRDRGKRTAENVRTWVPEPLEPTTKIDWIPAWSLTRDQRRYVPLAYCYWEAPSESGTSFFAPCGNGVAAGTCLEEALLQAVLELVERDAAAIWWYNEIRRPAVDLESFRSAYFEALQADYSRLGWSAWVLDLTHDLGIPTFAAVAHEPRADRFALGFGCHLDSRLAVQRALTELNQVFDPDGPRRAPWGSELPPSVAYLFPHTDLAPRAARELPRISGSDLKADVEHCISSFQRAGLELIAVDKTRPDLGLSVVQAIVPGLRHFWPRFAPGRLYETPCELGWLPTARAESALNPVPLFV